MNSLHQFPQSHSTHTDNTTPLKRTRAKRSCDFCRKRKSRCDADSSTPCSNCKAWGYTCEFETVRKKRGPPSVYVDNLEKKCKKMESLLSALTQCKIEDLERNDFKYTGSPSSSTVIPNEDTSSDDGEEDEEEDQVDSDKEENDFDSIKYTGHSSSGINLSNLFKSQSTTSIIWPGKENTVMKLMSHDELMIVQTQKSKSGKLNTLVDVGLSMKSSSLNHSLLSDLTIKTTTKPTRHQLDKTIGIYFTHLHPIFPIINKNKFLSRYHHASLSEKNSILVQAVLALAFRFASRYLPDQNEASEFSEGYFKKVVKRLRDSTRSKLSHVQAALLIVLYLDMEGDDIESMQWHTLGHAIRMAQDLGLHRSCVNWNLPPSEIETRHRVFYACYVMDRWHGARSGKPLTILDRDFDTDMPSPYEITDNESAQGLPVYRKFILLIQLSEILGRVLKALYAPNSKIANSNANLDDPNILAVLNNRLENWKNSLDEPLDSVFLSELDKLNLKIYSSSVILLLHRPFSTLPLNEYLHLQHVITDSEKICTETATELIDIVTQRQHQNTHPAYHAIFCAPSCFVYALFQSSLVFLYNALKTKSASDIQILHQSIDIMKKHSDITSGTIETLTMLISVNGLTSNQEASPTKISPIIPIKRNKVTSKPQSLKTQDEVPKSYYFQQRSLHEGLIKHNTDLKLTLPSQTQQYFLHRRQTQQQPIHQQVPLDCFVQNYPVYSNSNVYSHQRSISLDQLNNSSQQQQHMYTHHARSISHDDLAIMTGAAASSSSPSSFHRNTSTSKATDPNGMNVENMLSHGYSPQMNQAPHENAVMMSSFTQSLPPAPQAYTVYDPTMNISTASLPPSNLNWSEWDVYIGHQNSTQTEHTSSSPQQIQY